MKLKRKIKQIIKSFSVFTLVICLLAVGMPVASAAETVESVIIYDVNLIQNTNGYIQSSYDDSTDEYVEWYRYDYTPMFDIVLSDGTILESDTDGSVYYDDSWWYMSFEDDQGYDNQWGVGTHTVTGKLLGVEATFDVNIVESPVKEISVENVEVIENVNGYYTEDYDTDKGEYVEYYYYRYNPEFTVTLIDGTVLESSWGEIEYEGQYYDLDFTDDQGYDNPWGVGTHTVTASLLGAETTFEVDVIKSPIKEITVEDLEFLQNTNGYYTKYYDENDNVIEWYRYEYSPDFTVTLNDGTVLESDWGQIEYNGQAYSLDFYDDQSYEKPWGVGTYTVTAKILGAETSFDINILETPVKEITINSVDVIEDTSLYYSEYYDEETNEYIGWYCYDYTPEFTVTLKDGTVLESENGVIEYDDEWYGVSVSDDQSYYNQWSLGTHTATGRLLGVEATFDVNIVESPIKEITVDKIEVIKNASGYYDEYYDEETDEIKEWFCYDYDVEFTVTLKDGTVLESEYGSIEYNGEYFEARVLDNQSCDNPWGVGTHTATIKVLGAEDTFDVNVVETPVKDISVDEIEIVQYTNGYFNGSPNEEWYFYEISPEVAVTLNDGTVLKSKNGWIDYNGESYHVSVSDEQSYDNQWTIGTHTATVNVLGEEHTFDVKIVESPYESFEILEVQPSVDNGYYYSVPQFKYKVTKKDGTSFTGYYYSNYDSIDVDVYTKYSEYISLKYDSDSWTVGGDNELTVYYLGLSDTVTVEILPEEYEYIEQNGGVYITSVNCSKEDIVIPSEIDGKKVLGLNSLGEDICDFKTITLPDSLISIGQDAFKNCLYLEKINIGSGVTYLDANMFTNIYLKEINVSEENKNYCSVDGIVYDSAITTLVAYPVAGSKEYVVPATVSNIDVLDSFIYTDVNVTFADESKNYVTVDDVTYTADMKKVVRCNSDKTGTYEMPDSVVTIADNAFANCANLTDVSVSDNVTEIVYGAFANCTSLSNITIPDTVKKIGQYSFGNCTSLKNIDLPSDLEVIDEGAFKLSGLTSVSIPDKVTEINLSAFAQSEVANITFGKSLTSIGDKAFSNTNITSLDIPDNITELGKSAFEGCANLTELKIGKGITTISENAFAYTGFSDLVIPAHITFIGKGAFTWCKKLDNLTIEGTAVDIGVNAFYGCPLKNYDFDSAINVIGMNAFANSEIESLSLSPTVTEISYHAFYGCQNLSSIEIPDNVLKINGFAFDQTEWYVNQSKGEVYLDQIFYDYKGSMPGGTTVALKDGTVTIADLAFEYCSGLKEITLPEGLKGIGKLAFTGCDELSEINIPASVEYIGEYAFTNCSSLTAVNVSPDNKYFTSVDGVLFNKDMTELIYCPKQSTREYTVPESVKTIKTLAFDSSDIDSVIITSSETMLEDFAVGFRLQRFTVNSEISSVYTNCAIITCPAGSKAEEYAEKMQVQVSLTGSTEEIVLGDVNGDNRIGIGDATLVQMQVAKIGGGNANLTGADVDKDSLITIRDATAIQMYVARFITSFDSLQK